MTDSAALGLLGDLDLDHGPDRWTPRLALSTSWWIEPVIRPHVGWPASHARDVGGKVGADCKDYTAVFFCGRAA
jgi:hypothetical protein